MNLVERAITSLRVRSVIAPRNWVLHEDAATDVSMARFVSLSPSCEILAIVESRGMMKELGSTRNSLSASFSLDDGLSVSVALHNVDPEEFIDDFKVFVADLRNRYLLVDTQPFITVCVAKCSLSVRIDDARELRKSQNIDQMKRVSAAMNCMFESFDISLALELRTSWIYVGAVSGTKEELSFSPVDKSSSSATLADEYGEFARVRLVSARMGSTQRCAIVTNADCDVKISICYPIPCSVATRMRGEGVISGAYVTVCDTRVMLPPRIESISIERDFFVATFENVSARVALESSCRSVEDWLHYQRELLEIAGYVEVHVIRPSILVCNQGDTIFVIGFARVGVDRVLRVWSCSCCEEVSKSLVQLLLTSVVE